ncbi:hypothetical protein L1887_32046 [Cichorium endivia]|nr:hypothetical protein L1887_32046 [Cichorium endivia]
MSKRLAPDEDASPYMLGKFPSVNGTGSKRFLPPKVHTSHVQEVPITPVSCSTSSDVIAMFKVVFVRYVVFKIDEKSKLVTVDKVGGAGEGYSDRMTSFPDDDYRYAIFDFDFVTVGRSDGVSSGRIRVHENEDIDGVPGMGIEYRSKRLIFNI